MDSKQHPAVEPFPARHLAQVEPLPPDQQWLIEDLWLAAGVGILGGPPKVGKTFLAAQIALAVAANSQVLGRPACLGGPVLFYGAEDSLHALRTRFDGLAAVAGLSIDPLPIYLLDIPALRLDREQDLDRLRAVIDRKRPRLLVLDPFVRLARIDENSAAEVSAVLGSLRAIQRDYDLAVLLVHHARKSPTSHPHQALRGSSDFAAWSDSNLHLARTQHHLCLSVEHRSARAPDPLQLRLQPDPAPHLTLLDADAPSLPEDIDATQDELLRLLRDSHRPVPTVDLRQRIRKRKADVVLALDAMHLRGLIHRDRAGWTLAGDTSGVPCSHPRV